MVQDFNDRFFNELDILKVVDHSHKQAKQLFDALQSSLNRCKTE